MYSVMWSEHCSYKSSKVHLRQFGEKKPETDALLVGIGENAGVVDIGDGWAVTFKVESHNHPSYVEPYQGAATGVGGIVRDIMSMGARPVAVMDPLRFGAARPPRHPARAARGRRRRRRLRQLPGPAQHRRRGRLRRVLPGQPARQRPVRRRDAPRRHPPGQRQGRGQPVVLYGARTGGDGIGGVSVLASETFTDGGPTKRPSVQVGDPFMEKLLIECTLELFGAGLVEGIQDLGGAGISCATSELASNGEGGMHVWLDRVPLRDPTLSPEEILMSESQERMMAVVEPDKVEAFLAICAKWDVEAVVIGEVTDTGRLTVDWHGEQIVDVPPRTVAHEGPVYDRPWRGLSWQDPCRPTPRRLSGSPPGRRRPSCATRCSRCSPPPTSPPRTGSPTSTTATSWATRSWRSPRTPG
jgi:phosphoribosylformylglycinamidine synthase subunit PurL